MKRFKPRKCCQCDFIANDEEQSTSHYDSHIENLFSEGKFKCPECSFTSGSKLTFTKHTHVLYGEFKCEICKEIFTKNERLQAHRRDYHSIEIAHPFKCGECEYKTHNKYSFNQHMKINHNKQKEVCHICGKECKNLKYHIRTVHEGNTIIICNICGKSVSKLQYSTHMNNHNQSDNICTICGRFTRSKKKLIMHLSQEHQVFCVENDTFICHICKNICSTGENLQFHLITDHKLLNDNQCDRCEFTSATKILLARHLMQAHEADKIKAAEFLGNATKIILKESNPNRIPCEECDKTFSSKRTHDDHIKQCHRPHTIFCNECNFSTFENFKLKKHKLKSHTPQTKFTCDTCSFKCNLKDDLVKHIKRSHTKEYLLACSECGKKYPLRRFIDHMLLEHNIVYKHNTSHTNAH